MQLQFFSQEEFDTHVEVPEQTEIGLIPEGTYDFKVDNVKEETTKAGDPKLTLVYKVLDGRYKGRLVFDSFVRAGLKYFQERLARLGVQPPEFYEDPEIVVGREFSAGIKHKESNGYTNYQVYINKLLNGDGADPADPDMDFGNW